MTWSSYLTWRPSKSLSGPPKSVRTHLPFELTKASDCSRFCEEEPNTVVPSSAYTVNPLIDAPRSNARIELLPPIKLPPSSMCNAPSGTIWSSLGQIFSPGSRWTISSVPLTVITSAQTTADSVLGVEELLPIVSLTPELISTWPI